MSSRSKVHLKFGNSIAGSEYDIPGPRSLQCDAEQESWFTNMESRFIQKPGWRNENKNYFLAKFPHKMETGEWFVFVPQTVRKYINLFTAMIRFFHK